MVQGGGRVEYHQGKRESVKHAMRKLFFLFFSLIPFFLFAQKSTVISSSLSDSGSKNIDTNYVKFYKDKLIIALWQSERRFDILLAPRIGTASGDSVNYIANSNHVSGISVDYDIFSFAFGFRSIPGGNTRTGNTDYLDFGFNINTKGLRFENSYKKYTGFYDNNSKYYIKPFIADSTPYFQNPSLNLQVIKSKLIYSFNKRKFALSAAYANAKRQIKSSGSWLIIGNFYSMNFYSSSSFIPPLQQKYFGIILDGLKRVNVYAYSAYGGYSHTFVAWKKIYLNMLLAFGLETQYRHFYVAPENVHFNYWKIWAAADWRLSMGYNGKRFFSRLSWIYDITNYGTDDLIFDMKFIAFSLDIGYRFKFKAPKPYRKFQETDLYKKF